MKIAACDRNGITTDTNDRRITWQALIYDYRCFQCGKVPVQRYDFETETYYAECQGCGERVHFIHTGEIRQELIQTAEALNLLPQEIRHRIMGIKPPETEEAKRQLEDTKTALF